MEKQIKHRNLMLLFFVVSLLNVVGIYFQNQGLIYVSKSLIIPVLLWYYISASDKIDRIYLIGLLLCYVGDVLLLFKGEMFFILGLISFLLAHIFYSLTVKNRLGKIRKNKLITSILPFVIIYAILLYILNPYLEDLLYPVVVYGLVISLLGSLALHYFLVSKQKDALLWLIGASLFILSDSILAFNKFVMTNIYLGMLVMITYVLAQYFIAKAMLHKRVT